MAEHDNLPLTAETLVALTGERERDDIDFKETCDLRERPEIVAITKDIGAMQMRGGWLVIAKDDGSPGERLDAVTAKLFDPSTLTAKIDKYLAPGYSVESAALEVNGTWYAPVRVYPHPDVIAPFAKDGTYEGPSGQQSDFRTGEVFARHNSRSERWNIEDVRYCIERIAATTREEARADFSRDLADLTQRLTTSRNLAQSTILSWSTDPESLVDAVLDQQRANDDIPLKLLAQDLPRTLSDPTTDAPEIAPILDAAATVAGALISVDRIDPALSIVTALQRTYDAASTADGMDRTDLAVPAVDLRLAIITRAWALGALAVRAGSWQVVRALTAHRPRVVDPQYWSNWLFHGLVWAARGNRLNDPQSPAGISPLELAADHVSRLRWLRPDVADGADEILTSLCQFDLLSNAVAISTADPFHEDPFLGHFGRWYAQRSDPAAILLIEDRDARDTILPGTDDHELARALRMIDAGAERTMAFGRRGYGDAAIIDFINANDPQS